MKDDGVHENFFTVPELPHKKKEREAILLLQRIIFLWKEENLTNRHYIIALADLLEQKEDLVDWVMKYKGE